MLPPTAHVRRATLHAVALDAGDSLLVLHAAESVLHRALEGAASALGEEVLVLRRVDLRFRVELGSGPIESQLGVHMREAIRRRILDARPSSTQPIITEHAAWFPSEASAVAELLAAQSEGRAAAWPYRSLTSWGVTPSDVLRNCLARGRGLLGDVLAAAARLIHAERFWPNVSEDLARAIVAAWTEGAGGPWLAASALPDDVRAVLAAKVAAAADAPPAGRELVTLANLFALWPPARDLQIPSLELQRLAGRPDDRTAALALEGVLRAMGKEALLGRIPADAISTVLELLRRPRELGATEDATWRGLLERGVPIEELRHATGTASAGRLVSVAGGLAAWAALFQAEGLFEEIADAYPDVRTRRAVLWAVGRALDDARIGAADAMLLLWAGEDPTSTIEPGPALAGADPEPLHRCAMRVAAARGKLESPLEAAPLADFVTLTSASGICVDAILAADVHDAIPHLVRRLNGRTGGAAPPIHVVERMRGDASDALLEVDVPSLPEDWRVAVRAFASLGRSVLLERWRAHVHDLRRWPAIIEIGTGLTIELQRADVSRVYGGTWLRMETRLGSRSAAVRAV
jgi:hypothetical protein